MCMRARRTLRAARGGRAHVVRPRASGFQDANFLPATPATPAAFGGPEEAPVNDFEGERLYLERFGLEVGTIYGGFPEHDGYDDDEEEDEEAEEADDSALGGFATGQYGYGSEGARRQISSQESELERLVGKEVNFHFNARRKHEQHAVMDKAFELHHAQMERSVNPFQTTLLFGDVLEQQSHMDEAVYKAGKEPPPLPDWVRGMFALEEMFDEFNDDLRVRTDAYNKQATRAVQENPFALYAREDLEQLQETVGTRARLPTLYTSPLEAQQAQDDGPKGERFDDFLDVMPGVHAREEEEAMEYAQELLPASAASAEGDSMGDARDMYASGGQHAGVDDEDFSYNEDVDEEEF